MFLCVSVIHAQEDDETDEGDLPIDSEWDYYMPELYSRGDQTFMISLGMIFPTVFLNNEGKRIDHNFVPPVGGSGSLSYNYFLGSNFFIGGEISGMFNPTLGQNTVFIIPLGLRAGYQFIFWRLEFPMTLTLGMSWHRFLDEGYFGMYMKAGGAVYYRFNPDWSFGLNSNWCWFPEWTNDWKKNVHGNIVDLNFSVRYHF
jgi:hypothetical protein